MLLWPRFVLDPRPYLLLKLRNNSNIGFYLTKMSVKPWLLCNYVTGVDGVSDQQTAFLQSQIPLNPHSTTSIAMNPRMSNQGMIRHW